MKPATPNQGTPQALAVGGCQYIQYGRNNVTPVIKGEQYLDRKRARELAKQYMKEASPNDVNKLDKFYQGNILSSVLK